MVVAEASCKSRCRSCCAASVEGALPHAAKPAAVMASAAIETFLLVVSTLSPHPICGGRKASDYCGMRTTANALPGPATKPAWNELTPYRVYSAGQQCLTGWT